VIEPPPKKPDGQKVAACRSYFIKTGAQASQLIVPVSPHKFGGYYATDLCGAAPVVEILQFEI